MFRLHSAFVTYNFVCCLQWAAALTRPPSKLRNPKRQRTAALQNLAEMRTLGRDSVLERGCPLPLFSAPVCTQSPPCLLPNSGNNRRSPPQIFSARQILSHFPVLNIPAIKPLCLSTDLCAFCVKVRAL